MEQIIFYLIGYILAYILLRFVTRYNAKEKNREYTIGDVTANLVVSLFSWIVFVLLLLALTLYLVIRATIYLESIKTKPPKWL